MVVGSLCTGLLIAWFTAWLMHSITFPLYLGTSTLLLHHSDVFSTPR